MITQRDLDAIGPPPPRYPARSRPPAPEASLESGAVSVAAVLTISAPCPRPVLDDLAARVAALLAAGARELVLDLSAVTDADTRLLRALGGIHQGVDDAGGSLVLTGAPPVEVVAALHAATLTQDIEGVGQHGAQCLSGLVRRHARRAGPEGPDARGSRC